MPTIPVAEHFTASSIASLRRAARKADTTQPEGPHGWSKSDADPMRLLKAFPSLRIRDGFVLCAYQFRSDGNGNGWIIALPADAPFPEPGECPRNEHHFLGHPVIPCALKDYMDAIDGDGSLISHVEASILARELAEFGAMWHGISWGDHHVLDSSPFEKSGKKKTFTESNISEWGWEKPIPDDWRPSVHRTGHRVTFVFYTYSGQGKEHIVRHTDSFRVNQYTFRSATELIGQGPHGFVY